MGSSQALLPNTYPPSKTRTTGPSCGNPSARASAGLSPMGTRWPSGWVAWATYDSSARRLASSRSGTSAPLSRIARRATPRRRCTYRP